jgi:DNA-binding IclR family transcriptional regulator
MAILDAFLDGSPTLSVAEIASRGGLSRTTCHRLLATLEAHRAVARTSDGRYELGITMFQIGALVRVPSAWARVAEPHMRRLAEAMQIGCFLSIRERHRALCVHRVDRGHVVLTPYLVGQTLPLHVGAAPLILLAGMPADERDEVLRQPLERLTSTTVTSPGAIRKKIAAINRDGYVVATDGDIAYGISAIGSAIRDRTGATVAAISLSGLSGHISHRLHEMLPALQVAATAISEELGAA